MSKLSIDRRTIKSLFQERTSDFLIPDYQRPYAWDEDKCTALWDDLFDFSFPEDSIDNFNEEEEYFLGPIVTYKNKDKKLEVIDGQQRLTTLMLLLRAFYDKFQSAKDDNTKKVKEEIEKCIWKTDIDDNPKKDELKIQSDVAGEEEKTEFLNILKTGIVEKNYKSRYAVNYNFFKDRIDSFINDYPMYTSKFPQIIMKHCILLPIEADNRDTALRIFSTLNDRGMPLSDADLFKAQFYKYYSKISNEAKEDFITKWKGLETLCNKIFKPSVGTPMDELFTKYMYYERAKKGIKGSTTEALRKFYEKDDYAILKNSETFDNLLDLASFWDDIYKQDSKRFSTDVLRDLFVLNYSPNGMWSYFLSVYFMNNRDKKNKLDNEKLHIFLEKTIAFTFAYAFTNPGVNALRTPIYAEMVNIVNDKDVTFKEYKFDEQQLRNFIENYSFYNQRPLTKSMLTWWAFTTKKQKLLSLKEDYQIEHIYATNRYKLNGGLSDEKLLDFLGNKSLLEKRINITASDYKFEDKIKYYIGFTTKKGEKKEASKVYELTNFATTKKDYTEDDIKTRNTDIIDGFIKYVKKEKLFK